MLPPVLRSLSSRWLRQPGAKVAAILGSSTFTAGSGDAVTIQLDRSCLLDLLPQSLPSQLNRYGEGAGTPTTPHGMDPGKSGA